MTSMIRSTKVTLAVLLGFGAAGLLLWGLKSAHAGSDLERAVAFVKHCAGEKHLAGHDVFLSIAGEKKPSDWISFFLSPLGTANWVTREEIDEIDGHGAIFKCPFVPRDVVILADADAANTDSRDPQARYGSNPKVSWLPAVNRHVVLFADDSRCRVRAVGYEGWKQVLSEEWDFPRLAPVGE